MQKYLEYSKDIITDLKERYSDCNFNFKLLEENVGISVFFILANSSVLAKNDIWNKISNEIALKYQSKLETVYEKWNLYLIFITNDVTSKELKNKIENDKFSSRKIVEDCYDKEFNVVEANGLIVKHITNSDLKEILLNTNDKIKEEYKPFNNKLWKLIPNDISLSRDKVSQKLIVEQIIQISDEN
jgi:hypothetical protein